jgi:hypothetical protein
MTMALRDSLDASEVERLLAAAAIPGMAVVEVAHAPGRRVRTTWATYEFSVELPPTDLAARVENLLTRDSVQIERARDPQGVTRDIRPGVGALEWRKDRLLARLRIAQDQIVTSRDLALALNIEPTTTIRTDIELDLVG